MLVGVKAKDRGNGVCAVICHPEGTLMRGRGEVMTVAAEKGDDPGWVATTSRLRTPVWARPDQRTPIEATVTV
jgi:hypothetical protein